jgi:hypothetical protein
MHQHWIKGDRRTRTANYQQGTGANNVGTTLDLSTFVAPFSLLQ